MHEFAKLPQERVRMIASSRPLGLKYRAEPVQTVREALAARKGWMNDDQIYMMNSFQNVRTIDEPAFAVTGGSHQLGAARLSDH